MEHKNEDENYVILEFKIKGNTEIKMTFFVRVVQKAAEKCPPPPCPAAPSRYMVGDPTNQYLVRINNCALLSHGTPCLSSSYCTFILLATQTITPP